VGRCGPVWGASNIASMRVEAVLPDQENSTLKYGFCKLKMEFCDVTKLIFCMFMGEFAQEVLDGAAGASGEGGIEADDGGEIFEGGDEVMAGDDGGGGDGGVGLGLGALLEFEGAIVFGEGLFDEAWLGELVGEGAGALGAFFGEVGDDAGVGPGEELVEIVEGFVEVVVFFGVHLDDIEGDAGDGFNFFGEGGDAFIGGDAFGIGDAEVHEGAGDFFVGVDAGGDEGAEEVAFSGFVDPEVWLEPIGVVDLFVSEFGFAEDFGFEVVDNEVFGGFALDEDFGTFFVDGDGEFIFGGGEEGIGFFGELEAELVEEGAEGFGLVGGEGGGVACAGHVE
jgi:hypothetical protein